MSHALHLLYYCLFTTCLEESSMSIQIEITKTLNIYIVSEWSVNRHISNTVWTLFNSARISVHCYQLASLNSSQMDYISMNIQVCCVLWLAGMWCGLVLSPYGVSQCLYSDASSCGMLEGNYGRACGVLWAGLLSPCVLVVMVVPAAARGSFCRTRTNYSANAGHPIDTHSFNTATHTHTHLLYLPASKISLVRHAHTHTHTYIYIKLVFIEEFCCFLTTTF